MNHFIEWLRGMDPVGRDTNPQLACVVGFLFGGIGLAVYFRTVIDLVVPVALVIVSLAVVAALGAFGWLAGAIVAALYGYLRSVTSNEKRAAAAAATPAVVAS